MSECQQLTDELSLGTGNPYSPSWPTAIWGGVCVCVRVCVCDAGMRWEACVWSLGRASKAVGPWLGACVAGRQADTHTHTHGGRSPVTNQSVAHFPLLSSLAWVVIG